MDFQKKFANAALIMKTAVINAKTALAGLAISYKVGGKTKVREMINDFLEYFISSFNDAGVLSLGVIVDFLKSPKLIPAIKTVVEVGHQMETAVREDAELQEALRNIRNLFKILDDSTVYGKDANGIPNNVTLIIDPTDEKGNIRAAGDIKKEFDERIAKMKKDEEEKQNRLVKEARSEKFSKLLKDGTSIEEALKQIQ